MEEGISLLDVFKTIWKKRLVVFILFGVLFTMLMLLIHFVYNPLMKKREISVNYSWVGIENMRFANNEAFNYFDIISFDNVKKVIEKDSKYNKLNPYKISEKLDIQKKDDNYILTLEGYYGDDYIVKEYLYDLVYSPYEYATHLNFDFSLNIKGYYDSAKIFDKINYLDKQLDIITTGYLDMISYFGNSSLGLYRLSDYLEEIEVFVLNDPIDKYRYIAFNNGYMTNEEFENSKEELEILTMERSILLERKGSLLKSIKEIYESSYTTSFIDTAITNYLNTLHDLDLRLVNINESIQLIESATIGTYDKNKNETFIRTLNEYASALKDFTNKYEDNIGTILSNNTFINVSNYKELNQIGLIINIALSCFFAAGISCGIGFILGKIENSNYLH